MKVMKKKIIIIATTIFIVLCMMFAEYRFIMCNIRPYRGENGTVYLDFFGNVDEYYADPMEMEE
jgi:hypothetical protein